MGNWKSSHLPDSSMNVSALSATVSVASVTPSVAVDNPLTTSPSPRFTYTWMSATAASASSMPSRMPPASSDVSE